MSFIKGVKDRITVPAEAVVDLGIDGELKIKFQATFRRRSLTDTQDVLRRVSEGEVSNQDVIREDLVGWKLDGDGGEVEFSRENLDIALGEIGYYNALVNAWTMAQLGRKIALAKN